MQFTVPKFLERESVIAFGLTFKNLAIMAGLGFILFVLYYILPKVVFVLLAIILGGSFLAATFIKVGGQTLPQIIYHSFGFLLGGRIYVWNKARASSPVSLVQKKVKKIEKKEAPLKMAPQSRLSSLGSRLDFSSQKEQDDM
ncbi:MAG: hypothetical protein Q7R99_04080 [bacterium]|nr:hypothetical protein [bacterium]